MEARAVSENAKVVIVGLGEVGKPLFELISPFREVVGVDISPVEVVGSVEVLHVCYPFQIPDFSGETVRYIERYKPALTVINSTVSVGTTRAIAERTGSAVVNSPVRGKHVRMLEELRHYSKFIGALNSAAAEATELAKLTETTYFGVMIAWAQELERYCDQSGQSYEEITSFYDEIKFFPPVKYFPGIIGGHCVMPNIEILRRFNESVILEAVQASNKMKAEREARKKAEAVSVESRQKVAV
jgi:UDP-N-acetyl-D-mannosaminuronate dehydrogenase